MPEVTKYIYVMQRVRKAHQDKLILDDVTLAFLPGAKIGVVGPNGAGKSTVLEIMAGLETISNGEAALAPGAMAQLGLLGLIYSYRHPSFSASAQNQERLS